MERFTSKHGNYKEIKVRSCLGVIDNCVTAYLEGKEARVGGFGFIDNRTLVNLIPNKRDEEGG